ncbi:Gfo/Idh/MocA family oxidoreductase [candidate division KSB1 bacterium]|nr:Gfo/Idh/MocA family oxidoreductase [candidate division KSB1 bacterium]
MITTNRRDFLKKSTITTAGALVSAPFFGTGRAKGNANDKINIAVVGIRSRGIAHIRGYTDIPNVRVAALCDVDERLFPKAIAEVEQKGGEKPKIYVDFQKLLEDKDIDAVSIASPDHWHALHTIWACQAGKDVYIEKPISYTIEEGRKMVEAARKYNRVVQTGTQSRSSSIVHEAIGLLREGVIGDIYMGRVIVFGFRENIGHVKDSPVPEGVNWDLFLGPAPYRPFNENRFHYKWHWFWDTSTTEFGNNGTHGVDVIRWAMGKRVHPEKIQCMGGLYVRDSDQEIPNVQLGVFQYNDGKTIQVDVRSVYNNDEAGQKGGEFIYGSEGWMHITHTSYKTYLGKDNEPGPYRTAENMSTPTDKKVIQEFKGTDGPHMANFIDCVRTRRWQDLNADILEGHLSTTIMLLGNIAYRTGRTLTFNGGAEKFVDDDDANSYLRRRYRPPYTLPDNI